MCGVEARGQPGAVSEPEQDRDDGLRGVEGHLGGRGAGRGRGRRRDLGRRGLDDGRAGAAQAMALPAEGFVLGLRLDILFVLPVLQREVDFLVRLDVQDVDRGAAAVDHGQGALVGRVAGEVEGAVVDGEALLPQVEGALDARGRAADVGLGRLDDAARRVVAAQREATATKVGLRSGLVVSSRARGVPTDSQCWPTTVLLPHLRARSNKPCSRSLTLSDCGLPWTARPDFSPPAK